MRYLLLFGKKSMMPCSFLSPVALAYKLAIFKGLSQTAIAAKRVFAPCPRRFWAGFAQRPHGAVA
jgi:hypothetical protein